MKRTRIALVGAAVLLVALCAGSAGAGGTPSGPSTLTFTDQAGDAAGAADITNVAISGDATSGKITFTITAPGLEPATADGLTRSVDLFLNTDRNDATGSPGGNELDLYVWNDSTDRGNWSWDIERWSGAAFEEVPQSATMSAARSGDQYRLSFSTADLGGATSFDIYGASWSFDQSGTIVAKDLAPDGNLRWVYDLAGPTRTMTTFLLPTIGRPALDPTRVTAGKRVTVSFPIKVTQAGKTTPLMSGTMVCDPSIAAKIIPHAESFRNGIARLSFVVPKTAKGKSLRVKVTITPPAVPGPGGVWVDLAKGEQGVMATFVKGMPTTRITTVVVR